MAELPEGVQFVIERSEDDATCAEPVTVLRGWQIDESIGRWGGFVLEPFWTDTVGIRIDGAGGKLVRRKVLQSKEVPTAGGDRIMMYLVAPVIEDAVYLAGIRPGWQFHYAYPQAKRREEVAETLDSGTVQKPDLDRTAHYRALQEKAKRIMEAGGPPVLLNKPTAELEAYVEANGGTINMGETPEGSQTGGA